MTRKILAFGASTSKQSINKRLAAYAANQLNDVDVNLIDLNDFEMPIFSVDKERELGSPEQAQAFKQHIADADGIIISLAEHNGSFTAAYKNIYDWVSRIEKDFWLNRPIFLLATSPGKRGGMGVLNHALKLYEFSTRRAIPSFSLPMFHENFGADGITDKQLQADFMKALNRFNEILEESLISK